ncbi:MAG: glycoside hydrolase family 1 protein [Candidatus Sungbacteria bacterium]|uniref:Glycoside hydrolase family 1 protein n=1 Tax=Candidatus Sungiibacteriota bacterium TaxID=2750080 RepID=A0A9D6LNX6_9BACT|nr:glycoside hydrolase family 1 protein [Candidatus Sungbacteria bacterium]
METFKFPSGFFWGAATSAHQVEGANHNDWTEWEESPKRVLELKTEGLNPEDYISGRASDHYNRFREDFDIAKDLGHNAHRFSLEWSYIEPKKGKFDQAAIEHYREVIKALRERGIEPFLTLWHFTLPIWLRNQGGIQSSQFPMYFERYVKKMAEAFGGDVRHWITINEPEIYALNSYLRGKWGPQKKNIFLFYKAIARLITAHRKAYQAVKGVRPDAKVGLAVNIVYFESAGGPVNYILKWAADRIWNYHVLNHTRGHFDFIGLNHYFHNRIHYGFGRNKNKKVSDMGWEIFDGSLYHALMGLHRRFNASIIVTENGLADAKDNYRPAYIQDNVKSVARALTKGVNCFGYLHWSLIDNFEWDSGFSPRFGLVEVNYKTQERKIRPSALEYKKIIATNTIPLGD